jgi:hypothetical protein
MRPLPRIGLALAGVAAVLAGLWLSLLSLLAFAMSAQRPDPRVPDGDPCCGHPDTWGEVAYGIAYGVAIAYVALAIVVAGTLAAAVGVNGGTPALVRRHTRVLRVATAVVALLVVAVMVDWYVI